MKAAEGKLTVIAHVACNNTKDSQELARHAESLGVDAIAAIPRSISTCQSMQSLSTGMTLVRQHQTQTL